MTTSPRTRSPEASPPLVSGDARGLVGALLLAWERDDPERVREIEGRIHAVLEAAEAALALVAWDPARPHEPMGSAGVCRIDGYAWPCPVERLRVAVEQARGGTS